jgi:hypothetical protein
MVESFVRIGLTGVDGFASRLSDLFFDPDVVLAQLLLAEDAFVKQPGPEPREAIIPR